MKELVMLIGLPGSGKSTVAERLSNEMNAKLVSTDNLRKELLGNAECQIQAKDIFEKAHEIIRINLENGSNVIFDATNIDYKRRIEFIKKFRKIAGKITAWMVCTPYEDCLERNRQRNRKVPEEIIKKMYMNFYVPQFFEGFDKIALEYKTNEILTFDNIEKKLSIPHDNPNHNLDIFEHSMKTGLMLEAKFVDRSALVAAGFLHDIGKPFCKTFINKKGETTEIAHYYNHEKVGAYDSLFYTKDRFDMEIQLYIAQLIQWHMYLHITNITKKSIEKKKKLFGEEFWEDLEELHRADLAAH